MRFDPIPVATIQNSGITGFQEIFLSGLLNSPPDEIARGTVQRLFLQVRRSARSQADWKSWDITHSFRAFPAWNILNWSHRSDSTIPTEVKKGSLLLRQLLNRSAAVRSSFLI